ncbi:hypothetical protein GCM10017668_09660 [Streptomyces tuirus]|uniref:Uncharacterized protein n=1 Tax=Streptomyces tuirus TaxID=68278 RepID=A0A7G1N7U5_9ACTN|nr:hypothetical protein GCM10017668_09660 [Streptomyces tuirus]
MFVGEQADGAGDLAVQDASHGAVVGVRHCFPLCTVDQCSLTVIVGTDNRSGSGERARNRTMKAQVTMGVRGDLRPESW